VKPAFAFLLIPALASCAAEPDEDGEPTAEAVEAASEGPRAVVEAYYRAVSAREYDTAWQLWGEDPEAEPEEFAAFTEGFETTEIALAEVDEAGTERSRNSWIYVEVPVRVEDLKSDGSGNSYKGTYTLRRPAYDEEAWELHEGNLEITG
jgi:hypothetical protein